MSHAEAIDHLNSLPDLNSAQMSVALECQQKLLEVYREEKEFCQLCEFQSIATTVLAAVAFFGGILLAAKEEDWIGLFCVAAAVGLVIIKLTIDEKRGGAIGRASSRRDHLIDNMRIEIRRLQALAAQKASDHFAA